MKVKDCMCENVWCVKPETKINEIAKLMMENHIGCIPVCDNNNCICGILTDRDILLRTVACNKDTNRTCASDIMTTNVCCCDANNDVNQATKLMSENQVRRIPVVDNNKIVGILTLGDLAKNEDITNQQVVNTFENICNCNHKNAE